MGNLSEHGPKHSAANIVHRGKQLVLPQDMTLPQAIELIRRRMEYLETEITVSDKFNAFPQDGAFALQRVLNERYGFTPSEGALITVQTGPDSHEQVPWGKFELPGIEGFLVTNAERNEKGRLQFKLAARILRKHEEEIAEIFAKVRDDLEKNSIYKGQAIKIRFRDEDGDALALPEPQFLDRNGIKKSDLIFSQHIEEAVETNLFTPIERVADCKANNLPIKRGVLMGGPYGTGKTLAAKVAAALAIANGVTFVYVARAAELAEAVEFAKMYQDPACVVFCEDIDRAVCGERTEEMDDILNIVDGLDTKNSNIMIVLTTNYLEEINQAMLRPGRLDAIIDMQPPDAEAVERLIRHYGGDTISADTDLSEVGTELDGCIPAVIEEVVKRAKLAQLSRQEKGKKVKTLSQEALLESARTMSNQIRLLTPKEVEELPTIDKAFRGILNGDEKRKAS